MNKLEKKGIYKIINIETGDYYVGSSTLSFKKRLTQHISDLSKNKHRNIHLQRAYNKYGWENFIFVIIEILEEDSKIIEREQWYLDQKPNYNIATVAKNSAKGRKLTQEQKERLSQINTGRPAWNKGIPFSEESRLKMSTSMKGRNVHNQGQRGLTINPIQRSDGIIFQNPTLAADELGVKPNTIIKAASDKKKVRKVKGYTFKYIEHYKTEAEGMPDLTDDKKYTKKKGKKSGN